MSHTARKIELAARLEQERAGLAAGLAGIKREGNLSRKIHGSMEAHTPVWMVAAAAFGWILSRLPARKKKVYIDGSTDQQVSKRRGGMLIAVLKIVATVLKPTIMAFATKKLADMAAISARISDRTEAHPRR